MLWEKALDFHLKYGMIEAVAGVALGGSHLASIVAMHAIYTASYELDVIHVRKTPNTHGTKKLLEHPLMTEKQNVVLIEDVITTGNSAIAVAKAIEQEKFNVLGIISVVDRRNKKHPFLDKWPFRSLIDFEQLTP